MTQSDFVTATDQGFSLHGRVSFDTVAVIRLQGEKCLASLAAAKRDIEIDLTHIKETDASVFSLLLCFVRYAEKMQCTLYFTRVPTTLLRMRTMFGLTELIKIK